VKPPIKSLVKSTITVSVSRLQVGSFENLPYVEKKNRMRASIKRQRALNEYYSRKFSMTTLFPPTRYNWGKF
jgi:hypothetical protein